VTEWGYIDEDPEKYSGKFNVVAVRAPPKNSGSKKPTLSSCLSCAFLIETYQLNNFSYQVKR
jgi:hypothetical protein